MIKAEAGFDKNDITFDYEDHWINVSLNECAFIVYSYKTQDEVKRFTELEQAIKYCMEN